MQDFAAPRIALLLTLSSAVNKVHAERLPEWPDCKYNCEPSTTIFPNTGLNRQRVWPACPDGDEGCKFCEDKDASCPRYNAPFDGHGCEDNPSFMLQICPKTCNACHLVDRNKRCGAFARQARSLLPGDINRTFTRLLELEDFEVEVLSRDPWVALVHNVLREDELEVLLRERKWEQATDTGAANSDGRATQVLNYKSRRTDVHWCQYGCANEPPVKRLYHRVAEMLRMHTDYFEHMQLLR